MHSDPKKFRHDLRNLINSLRLALAAMDLEKEPADKVEWLAAIERTAEKGIDIIDEYAPFREGPGSQET
jgi:hypothetical protein